MEQRTPERDESERAPNPEGVAARHPTDDEDQDAADRDRAVDEAAADSFPGSDAPAW